MKKISPYLLIIFLFTSNVYAECGAYNPWYAYDVEVSLPFQNHPVNNGKYDDGICFRYQLNQENHKNIVCKLYNLNVGWMLYPLNKMMHDSYSDGSFTGNVIVILTNTGTTQIIDNHTYQYRVDESGAIAFHHDKKYEGDYLHSKAVVSCAYGN